MCRDEKWRWTLAGVSSWVAQDVFTNKPCAGLSVFSEMTEYTGWLAQAINHELNGAQGLNTLGMEKLVFCVIVVLTWCLGSM